jgi:hypothetical protein
MINIYTSQKDEVYARSAVTRELLGRNARLAARLPAYSGQADMNNLK